MLPRAQRITQRRDFSQLRFKGTVWRSSSFIAQYRSGESPRLGVIVSTKVGKSVVRKRAARLLREGFAATLAEFGTIDLVLIARPSIKDKRMQDVAEELSFMAQKTARR